MTKVPAKVRWEIFYRDGYRCMECRRSAPDVALVIDHIVPVSRGGPSAHFNLQTLCESCNLAKSDKIIFDDFPFDGDLSEWLQGKWAEYAELREAELTVLVCRELEGV